MAPSDQPPVPTFEFQGKQTCDLSAAEAIVRIGHAIGEVEQSIRESERHSAERLRLCEQIRQDLAGGLKEAVEKNTAAVKTNGDIVMALMRYKASDGTNNDK